MATTSTRTDDPSPASTTFVIVVFVAIVVIVVLGLQAYFARVTTEEQVTKIIERSPEELRLLQTEQLERISSYRWADRDSGTVAIPIERAMELKAAELAQDQEGER